MTDINLDLTSKSIPIKEWAKKNRYSTSDMGCNSDNIKHCDDTSVEGVIKRKATQVAWLKNRWLYMKLFVESFKC